MTAVVAVVFALLALAVVVFLVHAWSKSIRKAWGAAASQLGGHFDPKFGPWYHRRSRIDAMVSGVDLIVDHYTQSSGDSTQTHTRIRCHAAALETLKLQVYRTGLFSTLGRVLGFQDVKTGDAAFDDAFIVKSNNEDLARAVLSDEVRRALCRTRDYRFQLERGHLEVLRGSLDAGASSIVAAAQAAGALAARGYQLERWWHAVARSRHGELEDQAGGRVRIAVEHHGVPVRILARSAAEQGTVTRLVAKSVDAKPERFELTATDKPSARDLQPMAVEAAALPTGLALASGDPDRTAKRFGPAQRARIARLGNVRIEAADGEVRVEVPRAEGDDERLAEALELAAELAAQTQQAPYR
jgi:hypothetical protein